MYNLVKTPADFPNIAAAQFIGVDTETYDPDLKEDGPGWARDRGHIVGVSLAVPEGDSWYFPLNHKVEKQDNLPWDATIEYLSEVLGQRRIKIGANCMYDLGWLWHTGIQAHPDLWFDVQFAEALIDSNVKSTSLETLGQKYFKKGKSGNAVYEWGARHYYGFADAKSQGGNIYRIPASVVSEYACEDAALAMNVFIKQQDALAGLKLEELFLMECKLIPILVRMRMRGIPVDKYRALEVIEDLQTGEKILRDKLFQMAGFAVNINASASLAQLYDKFKIKYPRTEKGNPSFTAPWLLAQKDNVSKSINDIRKIHKAYNEFLQQGIMDRLLPSQHKICPQLHPLKGEGGGTLTGRFSSSKPNGQNIPSRDDVLAPLIRSVFVPEEGFDKWLKFDYSQIEYRMFAHFSKELNIPGASALVSAYQDPSADFHKLVGSFIGGNVPRSYVKCINFALLYGAGTDKIRSMLKDIGSEQDPDRFIALYHDKFPLTKRVMQAISQRAKDSGEIRTLLGRRVAFNLWAAKDFKSKPLVYGEAADAYGEANIEVANAYKAVNYLFQGSAADYLKMAMVKAYEAGIFDVVGYPHITVHDELDFSYRDDMREAFVALQDIMEHAIPLNVPMVAQAGLGTHWGNVKDTDLRVLPATHP